MECPQFQCAQFHAVRVTLDTARHTGWHEIDAVELVGPDGSAFATDATASSTWGQ